MLIYSRERSVIYKAAVLALGMSFKRVYKRRILQRKLTREKLSRPRYISATILEKRPYRPLNYYDSPWFRLISDRATHDPTTVQGKTFRKRFRVPYFLFLQLLELARELGFTDRTKSCAKIDGIPLELKVLGVLRVLGRGTCFDGIQELTGGSAEVIVYFFMSLLRGSQNVYIIDLCIFQETMKR